MNKAAAITELRKISETATVPYAIAHSKMVIAMSDRMSIAGVLEGLADARRYANET